MPKSKLMLEEKKGTPSKNTSTSSVASASTGIKSGTTQVSAKAQAVADKYGTQDSRYDMGNPEFAKTVNAYRDQQKKRTVDKLMNYREKVLNGDAESVGDRNEYADKLYQQMAKLSSNDAREIDFKQTNDFLADKMFDKQWEGYTRFDNIAGKDFADIDKYIEDTSEIEKSLKYGEYTDDLGRRKTEQYLDEVRSNIKTAQDYREARQVLDEWEVGDYSPEDIITAKNGEFQFIDFDEGIKDVDAQIRTLQAEVGKSMNVEEQIALTTRINELNNQREELKARKDYQDKFLISSELEGYMNEGDEEGAREISSLVSSHDDKLGERMLKTSASALVGFVNTPLQVIDASRDYIAELTGEDFDIRDKNNLSTRLNDLSRRLSNESLYGTNDVERIIVQITNSTVNQLARLPLGEAGSLITMSLQSGGEAYRENREMGYSHMTSLASAVANGIISYKVEQIGWEGLNNIIGSRAVNFSVGDYMHTLLTSSLSEGAEEVIEHFVDAWADELIHADYLDENGQIDWNKTAQSLSDTLKTSTDPKELWNAFYMGYLGGIALEGIVATPGFIQTKMQYNAYQRFRQNALEMMANDMFSTTKNGDNLSEYEVYEAYINMVDAGLRNYDSTSLTGKAIQLFSETVAPMTSVQESVNALKESLVPTAEKQARLRLQHTQMLSNYAKYLAMAQESLDAQGIDMSIEEFASLSSKSRETVARVARIQKATGINQRMVSTLGTMINGYNAKDRATMKGEIVLNANRENYRDVATALAHENLHTIEETAEGLKIADLIRSEYSAEEWKQMVNHKRLSYYNSFNNMALQALESGNEASAEQYRNDAQDFLDNDMGFKNAEHEVVAELFSEKRNAEKLANQMALYNTSGAYRMFNNLRAKVMKTDTDVQIANTFLKALKNYGIFGENATIDMDAQTEAENTRGLATIDYSLNHNEEIIEAQQKYAKKKGYAGVDPQVFEMAQQQMSDFAKIMREAMAKNPNVVPLETDANLGEVLIKDASYGVSVENWTKCIRALAYDEIVNFVSDKIGRPLNVEESFLVSQMLYDIAVDPQCLYCYVALDRKSYNEMVLRYIDQRDELIKKYEAEGKPEISEQNIKTLRRLLERKETEGVAEAVEKIPLFKEFLDGRKVTLPMLDRFADWITMYNNGEHLISKRDVATDLDRDRIANGNDASLKKQLDDLSKYAQGASWAKKDYGFRAYFDEIRKLSKKMVDKLNKHYGLRWYSFNDYTPAYILENMQQFTDASLRGLKGLAYTKDTDFAEIFAPTGCNINISVYVRAFKNENGEMEYRIDENQSANLEKAIELRKKYKNVGIVVTATSDEAVTWALEQEWSDVVIPFHIVRSGGKIAEAYKWTVYNASQADKVNDKEVWENYVASLGKKSASKMVYPSEHQNDYDKFDGLCKSRGLTPRFSQFIDILSKLHPDEYVTDENGKKTLLWKKNYMKLVNETRQSEAETQPIQPIFDMESAKRSWEWFEAKGGFYEGWYKPGTDITKAVDTIVKDVEAIERGEKTFQDIEYGERRAEWDDLMNSKRIREFMRQHGRQHGRAVEPVRETGQRRLSLNTDSDGRELSESQKEYFKNTKVVDAEGNLQVTYHGSPTMGITEFDPSRAGSNVQSDNVGIYFTNDKDFAEDFSYERIPTDSLFYDDKGEKGEVYKAYLNITNPLDFENLTDEDIENLVDNYINPSWNFEQRDSLVEELKHARDIGNHQLMKQYLDLNAISEDYDGVIANIENDNGKKEYIVFEPEQIKSTDNLNPTGSNDIRYSLGNGYDGYSMSNNAREAYEDGRKPISQFDSYDLEDFNEQLQTMGINAQVKSVRALKSLLERYGSTGEWHHTSSYYNETSFYDPSLVLDKLSDGSITAEDITEVNNEKAEKPTENRYRADFKYLTWSGSKAHPKATEHTLNDVEIVERGSFYYVYDDNGNEIVRKKIGSNGTEVIRPQSYYDNLAKEQRLKEYSNSDQGFKDFFEEYDSGNYEKSNSGHIYPKGKKPSRSDYENLSSFYNVGDRRYVYNFHGGYDTQVWDGSGFVNLNDAQGNDIRYSLSDKTEAEEPKKEKKQKKDYKLGEKVISFNSPESERYWRVTNGEWADFYKHIRELWNQNVGTEGRMPQAEIEEIKNRLLEVVPKERLEGDIEKAKGEKGYISYEDMLGVIYKQVQAQEDKDRPSFVDIKVYGRKNKSVYTTYPELQKFYKEAVRKIEAEFAQVERGEFYNVAESVPLDVFKTIKHNELMDEGWQWVERQAPTARIESLIDWYGYDTVENAIEKIKTGKGDLNTKSVKRILSFLHDDLVLGDTGEYDNNQRLGDLKYFERSGVLDYTPPNMEYIQALENIAMQEGLERQTAEENEMIPEEVQNQLDADALAEVDYMNAESKNPAYRMPSYTKAQQEAFRKFNNYDSTLVSTGEKATLDEVESDIKDMIKNDRIKDIKKNGFVESDAQAWEQHNKEVDEEIKNITSHTTSVEDANDNLKGIARILDENPKLRSETAKQTWRYYRDLFVKEFVDHGRAVYRLAKEVKDPSLYALYDYAQNVDNIVGRMFANKRVDLQTGEVIGKGFDEVFTPIRDSGYSREFQNYMYHKLNIDRMTLSDRFSTEFTDEDGKISFLTLPNKPVFNKVVTAKMSQEFCDRMEAEHPEFLEWAKDVYEYEDAELRMLVKSGRLSQEQMNMLKQRYPHYVPISREMDMKPFVTDEQVVSSNRAIKKATGGTANINPLEYAMQKHSRDVYSTILHNDLYWRIGQYYEMPVDAEFEQETDYKIDTMGNEVQPAQGENPPTLIYYENGERYVIEIDQDLYEALLPRNFAPDLPFVNGISNLRRNLITGWNPIFMFTNGIKDFQDAQFNTKFTPVEFNSAYVQAWNEIVNNGKLYQMYLNLGGEYNSYFRNDNGKVEGKGVPILSKVIALNEKVEIAPRLAEFICSIKHDMSTAEAMYNASDITTNFKRGGRTAKWMNRNGFNFLNASIQGFDKQVRNITDAKDKEGWKGVAKYMAKLSIINAIPLAILNGLVWDDDDEYAELSDYIKHNYYIIGKYGEGKFIRIPKGRIASFYQTVMENAVNNDERKSMWDNLMNDLADDMESFMNNVAPNNPIDNNLLAPIIQAHTNTAWYGDDIVPTRLQDERPSEQYDDSTDALSRAIGQFSRKVAEQTGSSLFELSPYKINYLLDQYTGMLGDIGLPMLTPRAENRIDNQLLSGLANPLLDKFTTDSTLKNQRVTDFYAMKEELNKLASSSEATEEQVLASKFMNSVSGEMSQLYKDKRAIQSDTSIPNSEKFDEARNIQEQIIELAKKGLTGYDQIDIRGENATVGDAEYKKSSGGDWAKTKTRDFSQYYSTYGLDEDKQSQFKSAMEVTSKKDENGKTIRNSEALATRKALEEMGEYENVLKYIEENGLEYKDFDLNKTVVGYDESKFNDKYNAVYETQEASNEPKSTSYTPRQNTSQNGSNDSEEDFFSTLLNIINTPVSTSKSGLSANVAQIFREGQQRSKSIRSNRDDLRKAIAQAKKKYNL